MIKQIRTLTGLQLKNIYSLNVIRYTKDKGVKQKSMLLGVVWLMLIAMIAFYVGATAYGYVVIGMTEILPAYLIMLSSIIILMFAIFKAGSVIFQRNAYDILCSLPVSQLAIVVSRFIRMYVENLMLTLLIMIPGLAVYSVLVKPVVSFYLVGVIVILFVPLLPITLATFFGALVTAIASRMKHKSLVSAILSILLVFGLMAASTGLSSQMAMSGEEITMEMLANLSEMVQTVIEQIFPPAVWMGNAMLGKDLLACVLYMTGALVLFVLTLVFISANYQSISQRLYSTTAKHDYKMQSLTKNSVLSALVKREAKRYFASSIYVTNTIVGPILAVVFAGGLAGVGMEEMQRLMGLPIDISGAVPFVLAGIFCVMGTSCTSISMEGKEWWIVKSLPIPTKEIISSKILFNILLDAPFYLVAEILLVIGLKPSMLELLWLVFIPLVCIVFSCVWGIFINLKMPKLNWDNEVDVVKQSASAAVGGLGAFVVVLVCAVLMFLVPVAYVDIVKGLVCIILAGATVVLYQRSIRTNLLEL